MNDMLVGILGLAAIAAIVISLTRGSKLWHTVLPVQLFAVVLSLGHAFLAGIQEKARGGGAKDSTANLGERETLLATGMADVTIRNHIKASALYVWIFAFLCLLFAIFIGLVPL